MRKITREVCQAFVDGKKKKLGNTETDGVTLRLFGNTIATRSDDSDYHLTLAGWDSATTRERLNGVLTLLGIKGGFHKVKGQQCYDGQPVGSREVFTIQKRLILAEKVVK